MTLLGRIRRAACPSVFGLLYGPLAPLYDPVSRFFFAGQWEAWQAAALEFVTGHEVLEIGFGTGDLLLEMCRRGLAPAGVDPSAEMRAIARGKLRSTGYCVRLLPARASSLPFPADSFDSVVCTFPSAYILEAATWVEARRVLRPGGSFVVVLSGSLRPVDHRSRLLIRFHRLVYGTAARARPPFEVPISGLRASYHAVASGRGTAHVLVARKGGESE